MRGLVHQIAGGFLIGLGFIIPGVSGAVLALTLGLYEPILQAVAKPFGNLRQNTLLLLTVGLGAGGSLLLFSKLLRFVFVHYPLPTLYLFFGLVLGSLPTLFRQANGEGFRLNYLLSLFAGFAALFFLLKLPSLLQLTLGSSWVSLLLLGAIMGGAVVVPGLSVSFLLLALGSYEVVLEAVSELNFAVLIPVGLGTLLTLGAASKAAAYALSRRPGFAYYFILGLLFASLQSAFPGLPRTGFELFFSALLLIAGIILASLFDGLTARG